jgi:hypothetical protein
MNVSIISVKKSNYAELRGQTWGKKREICVIMAF